MLGVQAASWLHFWGQKRRNPLAKRQAETHENVFYPAGSRVKAREGTNPTGAWSEDQQLYSLAIVWYRYMSYIIKPVLILQHHPPSLQKLLGLKK